MTHKNQERNYFSIDEFKEKGYLQEINRLFLHPLGLALEVARDVDDDTGEKGPWRISGVWDYRDDPEGIIYDEDYIGSEEAKLKAEYVAIDFYDRGNKRQKLLGYAIQRIVGAIEIGIEGFAPSPGGQT